MSDIDSIMFVTTLQQFWSIVTKDVIQEYEKRWLASFQSLEQKSGKRLSLIDFLTMMELKRTQCLTIKDNKQVPYDSWCWATLLPYFTLLKSGNSLAPIFQKLAECVNRESLQTQHALERVGNTNRFTLTLVDESEKMRRYWQMLCEGTNQYIFTVVYAMYLEALIQVKETPLRWCMSSDWFVQSCFVVDGVVVNSEYCIPGCKNYARKNVCDTLNCWRRSHYWLLLVLKNYTSKKTCIVNFDVTSALLGKEFSSHSRNVGCIPVNCGFKPYIWPGADQHRDVSLYVERRGQDAEKDKQTWNALSKNCQHIDDDQAQKMHEKCETFYAVASGQRLYNVMQISLQLASAQNVILSDLVKQKLPTPPKNVSESSDCFLQSITRLEMVQGKGSVSTVLAQMLCTAFGVAQLYHIVIKLSN